MATLILSLLALLGACSQSYAAGVIVKVDPLYLELNGTDVTVVCTASHPAGFPDVEFLKKVRTSSTKITNSTDPGRITVTASRPKNYTVQLSLHFKPILLKDESFYDCSATYAGEGKSKSQFEIGVLPGKAVPVFEMESNKTARKGEAAELQCKVSSHFNAMRHDADHPKLIVKWKFQNLTSPHVVDIVSDSKRTVDNTASQEGPDGNFTLHVTSLLKIKSVDFAYGGTYICAVHLQWTKYLTYDYTHNGTFLAVSGPAPAASSETEKVNAGSTTALVCPFTGEPASRTIWKKDDDAITSDDHYKISSRSGQINNILTINDVKYTDRGLFSCKSTNGFETVEKKFRLRVRDPLGPVWPFIGIIIETIILVIIIAIYEKFKKSKKAKRRDGADGIPPNGKETSPLLPKSGDRTVGYSTEKPGTVTMGTASDPVA